MKPYESVFIFDPSLSEDEAGDLKEKVSSLITQHEGMIHEVRYWGKRRFAYPIQKKRDGHYFLFIFDAPETLPLELNHFSRVNESVLRSMIIRRIIRKSRLAKKEQLLTSRQDEKLDTLIPAGRDSEVDFSPEPETELEPKEEIISEAEPLAETEESSITDVE